MNEESPDYAGEGIYKENILDHYKNPRNSGEIENPDIKFRDLNPLCGDIINWTVKIEEDKIKEIKFNASGCAISTAGSSMLSEVLEGKTLQEVSKMKNEEIFEMLGIKLNPMRVKCALLGLKSLQKAVVKHESKN